METTFIVLCALGVLNNYRIFAFRIKRSFSFSSVSHQSIGVMLENAESSQNCQPLWRRCLPLPLPVHGDTAALARGRQTRQCHARR